MNTFVKNGLMETVRPYLDSKCAVGGDSSAALRGHLQLMLCGLIARALGVGGTPVDGANRQFVLHVMTKMTMSRCVLV